MSIWNVFVFDLVLMIPAYFLLQRVIRTREEIRWLQREIEGKKERLNPPPGCERGDVEVS